MITPIHVLKKIPLFASLTEVDQENLASLMRRKAIKKGDRFIYLRIIVNCIAGYYQFGMSIDEILDSLHHLTPSQVHSALAYYFDHQDEINSDLEEAGNVEYWKSQVQSPPARQKAAIYTPR